MCTAESFAFARRVSFSLEGTYVRKLLAESKTPESERHRRNGWERARDGEYEYYRSVIDKKDEKKRKK